MNKSSILSNAGQNSISSRTMESIPQKFGKKDQQSNKYLRSPISDNLLQQMDDDYQQIQGIQSRYIDQNGKEVDQPQKQLTSKKTNAKQEKSFVVKKDKNSKNSFLNQPILQQPLYREDEDAQSPIKSLPNQVSLSSSQYESLQSGRTTSRITNQNHSGQPGTLLKNYRKSMNKYERQLDQLSRTKQSQVSSQSNKHPYLTNSRGLKQEDFYKMDYMNNGQYKTGFSNSGKSNEESKRFFNPHFNELDAIEDILSDINSLNTNSEVVKYTSANLFQKNSVSILSSSTKKYKGMKNVGSFNDEQKSKDSFRGIFHQKTNKLDNLLMEYQFAQTMGNSSYGALSSIGMEQLQKSALTLNDSKYSSSNSNNMTQSYKFADQQRIQQRRRQREENRKKNRFYESVKNQIKYGQELSQEEPFQSRDKDRKALYISKQHHVDGSNSEGLKEGNHKEIDQNDGRTQKQVFELASKIRIYEINWERIPIIPGKYSQVLDQVRSFPSFSESETKILISSLEKVEEGNINTYSIFSHSLAQKLKDGQVFGLIQLNQKQKDMSKTKQYKLMSEKEFRQRWNKSLKQSQSITKGKSHPSQLTLQEIKLLRDFDLKWYEVIVQLVYGMELSKVSEVYNGKKEEEYESVINTKRYIETINKLKPLASNKPSPISQSITANKLQLLKKKFSHLNSSPLEYSFGIIPSIITPNTPKQQQQLIKTYLSDNFRGGIYFPMIGQSDNICVVELGKNSKHKIEQISENEKKEVWVDKRIVFNLKKEERGGQGIERKRKNALQIEISLEKQKEQLEKGNQSQIKMNSYYNQIQYHIQKAQVVIERMNFCKKYKINLTSSTK